jgi:hypothetical protein
MAGAVRITWTTSPDQLGQSIRAWGGRVNARVYGDMQALAPEIEAYMKGHAPWTDRTGNARAGLHTAVQGRAGSVQTIYASHSVFYGKYLELKNGGRFAIISPTLVQYYPRVAAILREAFNGA